MNLDLFNTVASEIHSECEYCHTIDNLNLLRASLQKLAANPGQETIQAAYAAREKILEDLRASKFDSWPETWKEAARELHLDHLVGGGFRSALTPILDTYLLAPQKATELLTPLRADIVTRHAALNTLVGSMEALGLPKLPIHMDECELTLVLPRGAFENDLEHFWREIKAINLILGDFDELLTGSRSSFRIRAIASSEFTIYLLAFPPVCLALARSVTWILNTYEKLLDIRKKEIELARLAVPKIVLADLSSYASTMLHTELEAIRDDLVKGAHPDLEEGRFNELKVSLTLSLKKLAKRLARGFRVEFRIAVTSREADAQNIPLTEQVAALKEAASLIKPVNPELLSSLNLPEETNDDSGTSSR